MVVALFELKGGGGGMAKVQRILLVFLLESMRTAHRALRARGDLKARFAEIMTLDILTFHIPIPYIDLDDQ
jgi:hypothetical protein